MRLPSRALCTLLPLLAAGAALACASMSAAQVRSADEPKAPNAPAEIVVTASRLNLLGVAATASQGSVTQEELVLRPVYRVGQLLESTPGPVRARRSNT
jgi:outer membrane receptor protein involved in Fe transport